MSTNTRLLQLAVLLLLRADLSLTVSCPDVVSRAEWGAASSTLESLMVDPPSVVFIIHTAGRFCTSGSTCSEIVKALQDDHINNRKFQDIGYHFLVGGDGAVYEGRGWGKVGAHTFGYNSRSIGIALIGDFSTIPPSVAMIQATKELIACGVSQRHIAPDYSLYADRQAKTSVSPGDAAYKVIKTWSDWSPEWIYKTTSCKNVNGTCMDDSATCSGHYVSGKCSGPSYVKCCVPCTVELLDVQFLLDTSSSVGYKNFQRMKKLLRTSAREFHIGDDKIRFGIATFSTEPDGQVWLNSFAEESALLYAIDNMRYRTGYTNTHRGLDFVRKEVFTPEHGDRSGVTNVLIVITDGESSEPALTTIASKRIHQTNTVVIAVGIGDDYNVEELEEIATDNTTVFRVEDFAALNNIHEDLREKFCKASRLVSPPCPNIVSGTAWGAKPTTTKNLKVNPPTMVILHHTTGNVCTDPTTCKEKIREIQEYHINNKKLIDISYNFLIGGDGVVYEGRGWGKEGAHAYGYNNRSIGIALIGDFTNTSPPQAMLNATEELINCGVSLGKIRFDYSLYGQRQLTDTESPGEEVYDVMKTWKKWNADWLYSTEQCTEHHGRCADNSSVCLGHYVWGLCPGPSYVQCCVPCPVPSLDIQFLLDTSSSIGSHNFQKVKDFVRNFAQTFHIGRSKVQFGVASFSTMARNHLWLNSHQDKPSLLEAIDSIRYHSGYSNTHRGLDLIREQAFTAQHGDRDDVANVLIVLTDGESSEPSLTTIAAEKIHESNVLVLAVGVGEEYKVGELRRIATDNTTLFHVDEFADLDKLRDILRQQLCGDDAFKDQSFSEAEIFIDDVTEEESSFSTWGIIMLIAGIVIVVVAAVIAGVKWIQVKN